MKLLKKVLVLILVLLGVLGAVWGIDKIKDQRPKIKTEENRGEKENQLIKFAVMADVHSDWDNFKSALEIAKKDESEFVIVAGDLTTIGKKEEFLEAKKILDESGLKYYIILGNHDVWYGRRLNQDIFGEVFGNTYFSFKKDGFKFILINNGDDTGGLEKIKGTEGQKKWIEKETEECLKIDCLVFLHIPLNHPSSIYIMGQDQPAVASQAGELIELFKKNKVKELFAGHLHFSSNYELDGLKTTIVGALTSERNFQSPKFLEIWAQNDGLKKQDIYLEN